MLSFAFFFFLEWKHLLCFIYLCSPAASSQISLRTRKGSCSRHINNWRTCSTCTSTEPVTELFQKNLLLSGCAKVRKGESVSRRRQSKGCMHGQESGRTCGWRRIVWTARRMWSLGKEDPAVYIMNIQEGSYTERALEIKTAFSKELLCHSLPVILALLSCVTQGWGQCPGAWSWASVDCVEPT